MNKLVIKILLHVLIFFTLSHLNAQQENVPVDHPVYLFIKEMNVKNLTGYIHNDNPGMSREEVLKNLNEISENSSQLSGTEKKILKKYIDEFDDTAADGNNTFQMFGSEAGFSKQGGDFLSDKIKYTYAYKNEDANYYLNILGRVYYGQSFKPRMNNAELYDIGFRFRGTLFDKLGYSLTVQKGGVSGSRNFAVTLDPRLSYNFKYVEDYENINNYDFTEGYLRYKMEPVKDMSVSLQMGREKIKFGYGYGSSLVLSGNHPVLDFIKLNFNYGVFDFTSIHASTVGNFNINRALDYTKFIAINRFKLHFGNSIEFGLGEGVVYSGRGLDLAYLNPFAFYKFEEMSLQDRDNGVLWLDMQTRILPGLELQGTFFLDDDPLGNLQDLSNYINKTGYQLGAFWYSPFSLNDLSFVFEYTRIRPYVYSHVNYMDSYTSWNQVLGHEIGPNSDEILARIAYNYSERLRLNIDYQFIRHGDNIYDSQGNLVFNSGGDPFVTHRLDVDPVHILFLDGDRTNANVITLGLRFEPVRQFVFDFVFKEIMKKNVTHGYSENQSYAYLKLMFEI